MAEEQFTSRRARREAERLAAEQAFEAREVPEQPNEAPNSRADLLSPQPPKKPDAAPQSAVPESGAGAQAADPGTNISDGADSAADADTASAGDEQKSRIDPDPSPRTNHERGALASDHPVESRPPVHAEDRLDPQRAPLPHFQTRAERKRYLKEHGLSFDGDLSTGAIPTVADEQELADRQAAAEGRLTGPVPEVGGDAADDEQSAASEQEHESYDAAGFGGATDEVAARDFEAPVTAASAPRPTTLDDEPYDALSMPYSALEGTGSQESEADTTAGDSDTSADVSDASADEPEPVDPAAETPTDSDSLGGAATDSSPRSGPAGSATPSASDEAEPASRSRRMPIVQPPSTSGVRVVTAASAQIPEAHETSQDRRTAPSNAAAPNAAPPNAAASNAAAASEDGDAADQSANGEPAAETGSDDAARALAANPETRPMDAVPEAWSLPNADYEDEETENPPGSRIPASSVTGQDGQILMGEEPSKMPYIVLGVAAFFALALIVIALVMFL